MYGKLHHPICGIVCGPSMVGKTRLTIEMLNNDVYDIPMKRVHWFSEAKSVPERSALRSDIDIEFMHKLPEHFLNDTSEPLLIVIDDFMDEAMNSVAVSKLFTKDSHHQNISVILLTQNIYNPGKYSRNISLNSSFYILFRNIRDQTQINRFLQQVCGSNAKAIQKVFKDAVHNKPHSYLFIDFSQSGHDLLRLRTNIFKKDAVSVYCPAESLSNGDEAAAETTSCGKVYAINLK